jgi:hypothetical protein
MTPETQINELLQRFQECDLELNQNVSNQLVELDSTEVVLGMKKLLQTPDVSLFTQKQAVKLLGRLNSDCVPVLSQALFNPNVEVCKLAAQSLGAFENRSGWNRDAVRLAFLQGLTHPSVDVRKLVSQGLGKFGSELTIPDLLAVLTSAKGIDCEFRDTFKGALIKQGRIAIPMLLQALKHSDIGVRRLAVEGVWCLGTQAEIPDLLRSRQDLDSEVRSYAESALEKIREPQPFLMRWVRPFFSTSNKAFINAFIEWDDAQFIGLMREQGFVNERDEDLLKAFQQIKGYINSPRSNTELHMTANSYVNKNRAYDELMFIEVMRVNGFASESKEELIQAYFIAHYYCGAKTMYR